MCPSLSEISQQVESQLRGGCPHPCKTPAGDREEKGLGRATLMGGSGSEGQADKDNELGSPESRVVFSGGLFFAICQVPG